MLTFTAGAAQPIILKAGNRNASVGLTTIPVDDLLRLDGQSGSLTLSSGSASATTAPLPFTNPSAVSLGCSAAAVELDELRVRASDSAGDDVVDAFDAAEAEGFAGTTHVASQAITPAP